MLTKDCFELRILDHIVHADRNEILSKIRKGAIVSGDQVRIDNETWIGIENVPEFAAVFEEIEREFRESKSAEFKDVYTNFQVKQAVHAVGEESSGMDKCCSIHHELLPMYVCTVCESLFCESCPTIENGLKVCPFCGGRCVLYCGQKWKFEETPKPARYNAETGIAPEAEIPVVQEKLEWKDFATAIRYSFRFPGGFLTGALLSAALVFGLIVALFQGGWMLAIGAVVLITFVVLQFRVLGRTFENFARTDDSRGFMPHIEGFSVHDDIVGPIFTGFASYFEAFGAFSIAIFVAIAIGWSGFEEDFAAIDAEAGKAESRLAILLDRGKFDSRDRKRIALERRMRQMETVFGKNHLVENSQFEKLFLTVTRMTIWYQVPVSILFVIGLLIFPGVCLSTAENERSLRRRLTGGLTEMWTLGFDYVKLFIMFAFTAIGSAMVVSAIGAVFSKLELPIAGTLVSITLASIFAFYFWVSFSAILGIARKKRDAS